MFLKANFFVIPLITLAVALAGGYFSAIGLKDWYGTLNLPAAAPPGSIIGLVWTIIYVLTAASALIVWNGNHDSRNFWPIIFIFIANAALNVLWSYLFFQRHLTGLSTLESALLDLTVISLIALAWPLSKAASYLLVPYGAWVAFATYLNYLIWRLNG